MRLAGLLCTGLLGALSACLNAPEVGDPDTPPTTGQADIEQWLAKGYYLTGNWSCQSAPHRPAEVPASAHVPYNRICSNAAIASRATSPDKPAWPAGASAVKELYEDENQAKPAGYAVYLKTAADSEGGAKWYWYERVPLSSTIPHAPDGVVADSVGAGSSVANGLCVTCHLQAGKDQFRTTDFSHDLVYTAVPSAQ